MSNDNPNYPNSEFRTGSGQDFLGTLGQTLDQDSAHVSIVDETSEHFNLEEDKDTQEMDIIEEGSIHMESEQQEQQQQPPSRHQSGAAVAGSTRATPGRSRSGDGYTRATPGRTNSTRSRSPSRALRTATSSGSGGMAKSISDFSSTRRGMSDRSRSTFERTATGTSQMPANVRRTTPGRTLSSNSGRNLHSSFVRRHDDEDEDEDDAALLDSEFDLDFNDSGGAAAAQEDSDTDDFDISTNTSEQAARDSRRGSKNLWKPRKETRVDQSINLKDHETAQYQRPKLKKPKMRGLGFRQRSLVDIFLADDRDDQGDSYNKGSSWGLHFGDSSRDLNKQDKRAKCTRWIFLILLILIMLAAFIIVPDFGLYDLVAGDNNAAAPVTTSPPTPAPTEAAEVKEEEEEANLEPEEDQSTAEKEVSTEGDDSDQPVAVLPPSTSDVDAAQDAVQSLVVDQDISDPVFFRDPESPQTLAMQWIVKEDPAKLPIPGVSQNIDDEAAAQRQLVQRYALAVLYFAQEVEPFGDYTEQGKRLRLRRQRQRQLSGQATDEERENRLKFDLEWTLEPSVCQWPGVKCNDAEEITGLNVSNSSLGGFLPREILRLPALTTLDLSYNHLHGTLPSGGNGEKSQLKSLLLQHNLIQGTVEALMDLPHLQTAELSTNHLTGNISSDFASRMTELENLHLAMNRLTGTLPSELATMTQLVRLDLEGCLFTGSIPEEWAELSNLEVLTLSHCESLGGTIPPALASMSNMKLLSLQKTNLEGPIPSFLGNLTELKELYLHNTKLTGEMPNELCTLRDANTLEALTSDCSDLGAVACDCCTDCFSR